MREPRRLAAALALPAHGIGLIEEGAGCRDIVGQTLGEQLVAQRAKSSRQASLGDGR